MAVTRFYLPSSGTAAVSPAISGTDWAAHINTLRRPLNKVKGTTSIANTTYTPDGSDHLVDGDAHVVQFVSGVFPAQTIPAQTIRGVVRASEAHSNNNLFLAYKVYLVNTAGDTVLATLASITRTSDSEFATSLTNRNFSASISATAIDQSFRVVLELGWGGLPTAAGGTQGHNGTYSFGENAGSDCAFDNTGTAANNPWFEFVTGIGEQQDLAGAAAGAATVAGALAVARTLAGAAAGAATVAGALAVARTLQTFPETWPETFAAGAEEPGFVALRGRSAGAATVAGALAVARTLAGASAGETVVTGNLAIPEGAGTQPLRTMHLMRQRRAA